jgi:N-methylhydantoinase A
VRIGIDTGGTFTDVVAAPGDGSLRVYKLPSLPHDPAQAVLDGLRGAGGDAAAEVVHSTTVATNALLERRGGPTVLVTTRGFEDVLALARQARPSLYALHPVVPEPLVGDEARLGVDERLDADGRVRVAPTDAALEELRERVRTLAPASVAVCLLHAWRSAAHERRVAEALAPLGVPLSLSSEVLPLPREYERTSTTVADAYVKPVMAPYLSRLGREVARLRVMQSNGGAAAAGIAPVHTLLSGPAAGVVGAAAVARACGVADVLTFDMGGTSTDVAVVERGEVALSDESVVGSVPLQLTMLAIHTVGAGGGSIARVDEGGALKVGPASAGADPGPACYGRGGTLPTVTDANLVLGRLPAAGLLGGAMPLDVARARSALVPLAARLGRTLEGAAEDVLEVACAVMARAIKAVSVERGHDPAAFALLPFGGAGAMHACHVARELGMTRILVPPSPGLLCAWGALAADVAHELVVARMEPAGHADALAADWAALEARAHALLDGDGAPPARRELHRRAALRYRGQSFELEVPAEGDLVAAFHAAHQARWGHALPDHPVELCSLRLRALGRAESLPLPVEAHEAGEPLLGRTTAIFGGRAHGAALISRRRLRPGARVEGPALVIEYSATTVLPPEARAHVLDSGVLELSL